MTTDAARDRAGAEAGVDARVVEAPACLNLALAAHGTTRVQARWYDCIADFPAAPFPPISAEHISQTPEWAGAWEKVSTERIRAFRHMHLSSADRAELVSFYLVDLSPFWTENEQVVGVDPVWPGPVVYAPSPYAEYGGAGAGVPEFIGHAVDGGLRLAQEWGAVALVFMNLTPAVLDRWRSVRQPTATVLFDVAYSAPVRGSMDAFLAAMPSSDVRREFRRQWRRGRDAGLTVRVLPGVEMRQVLAEFTGLTVETSASHGYNMYGADLFDAVAEIPGAVMLAAEHDGTLAGGFLCLRFQNRLYTWTAGIDYGRLRELRTYGSLMYEAVNYAAETGAELIDVGRSNHVYKRRMGFTGEDLYACAYLTRPDPELELALADLHERLVARNHGGPEA
jgi:hypothetical protein